MILVYSQKDFRTFPSLQKEITYYFLAGVAQWIECRPAKQSFAGKRQPHIDVALPLFLLPFPSL